jgi:hypothetical protein
MGQIYITKAGGNTNIRQTSRSINSSSLAAIAASGLFRATGDVWLYDLILELNVLGTPTAETIRFSFTKASNSVTGFMSAASASIAGLVAGSTLSAQLYAVANAPLASADGAGINPETYGHMFIPTGVIGMALGGTTGHTGTWSAYATYESNEEGAMLLPLF